MRPYLRNLALGSLTLLPLCTLSACGDDESSAAGGAGGTGGMAGSAGTGGTSGSAGASGSAGTAGTAGSGGTDLGPFGETIPITSTNTGVTGLTGPVNVVRDRYGVAHIYARNLKDAMRLQGWMMMTDRAPQMELLRRVARGRLAELLGNLDKSTIDTDITIRSIGIPTVAQQMYDALPAGSETKEALDAFADGITQYVAALQAGTVTLPGGFLGIRASDFGPWSGVDTLALGRIQTYSLSYDGTDDVNNSGRLEAFAAAFPAASADPLRAKRAGAVRDLLRWAPADATAQQAGFPTDTPLPYMVTAPLHSRQSTRAVAHAERRLPRVQIGSRLLDSTLGFSAAVDRIKAWFGADESAGSNNWAVDAAHSATGNAMVASDPHLDLSSPPVFWPTHVVVDDPTDPSKNLDLSGLAFAGIPGIILGTNGHVAWGATVAAYDVTDNWRETLSSDASSVTFEGAQVPITKRSETIKIKNSPDYTFDVSIVPHHGPIAPKITNHVVEALDPATGAVSIRWTGHQPTDEIAAIVGLWRARNVDDARQALSVFGTGAQNWTLADDSGNIFTYSIAKVPYRDHAAFTWDPTTYAGTTPNFALAGDGTMEWTGEYLEEIYIPKQKNPTRGFVASANGDQIGTTFDNDPTNETTPAGKPFYLQGDYDLGYRIGRIYDRLEALTAGGGKVSVADMQALQGDVRSPLGAALVPRLIAALQKAEAEKATPGTHPDLTAVAADARYSSATIAEVIDLLQKWGTDHDYQALSGVDPSTGQGAASEAEASRATALFNAWLVKAIGRVFEDETTLARGLSTQMTAKALVRIATIATPSDLATYDAATGESALWDDLGTAGTVESSDERFVISLLDAVEALATSYASADRTTWLWGKLHTITFEAQVPLWPVTNPDSKDAVFPDGFPRHGDMFVVDACNFSLVRGLAAAFAFNYGSGPTQRFVAEMTPTGPKVKNAIPGGAQMWRESPWFGNQAELWRRNETYDLPLTIAEVASAATDPGGQNVLFRSP